MKKYIISFICAVSLFIFSGCMDLITEKRDVVSSIKTFAITPTVLNGSQQFLINIDANVGYNMYIFMHKVGVNAGNTQRVYEISKEDYDNKSIVVNYEHNGVSSISFLSSNNKAWITTTIEAGMSYDFFLTVCDFAIVAGNGHCETSNAVRMTFY